MNEQEIHKIVKKQRAYFCSGAHSERRFRLAALKSLKAATKKDRRDPRRSSG